MIPETIGLEALVNYGFAGIALYMIYNLCNKKLDNIVQKLDEIKEALKFK